ncbi:DUF1330 domain-containing protein [Maribacter sp. 4G9]|uniref:DUF1330 domain-containing protein n=1 Tax=Maribacter sp. 4G9 TaxID=1889777 RepID=UPI000C15FD71|nr:DUF1330 domain-containing protein [Maribacter sp. 4G9]PIB27679.1 hypothetical protein BFP75_07090 [Maribacter sp. 4G9]
MNKVELITIGLINQDDKEALDLYLKKIDEFYSKLGAKVVAEYQVNITVLGNKKADFITIVEFPNKSAVENLFYGEEYIKILPYRNKAFIRVEAYLSK